MIIEDENMKKNNYTKIFVLIIFLLIASIISSFTTKNTVSQKGSLLNTVKSISLNFDYSLSSDISQMSKASDYIVIGKYVELEKVWNMRRDINDIKKESTTDYVEGKLYKFTISDVVKGSITERNILVNHRHLEKIVYENTDAIINTEGIIIKPATVIEEVTVNVQDPLYIEPQIGGSYMLFLSKDNNFGNYYGATEPFMIKIENDKAVLQSNLINKEGDFVTTARASNGDNIQINVGGMKLEDTITGMTLDELKAVIK